MQLCVKRRRNKMFRYLFNYNIALENMSQTHIYKIRIDIEHKLYGKYACEVNVSPLPLDNKS